MIRRFYRDCYDELGPFWFGLSVLIGSGLGGLIVYALILWIFDV